MQREIPDELKPGSPIGVIVKPGEFPTHRHIAQAIHQKRQADLNALALQAAQGAGHTPTPPRASELQVGGDHYKKLRIQPMRYSMENGLDALQHTAVKYITRFRDKGGVKDLEKAKHCIDMLIQYEINGNLE